MPFLASSNVPTVAFTAPTTDREIQIRNCCAEILDRATQGATELAVANAYVAELRVLTA